MNPVRRHLAVAPDAAPPAPTFDDDVRRYVDLQAQIAEIAAEVDQLKARIREHGSGRVGDLTVTVAQARRFSQTKALEVLPADTLAAITVSEISATKAKQVLAPAVYELLMYPYGEARVSVR